MCRVVQALPLLHFFRSSVVLDGLKMLLMTLMYQAIQRVFQWISLPSNLAFTVSATFYQHDPAYHWLVRYLAEKGVWKNSTRDFIVLSRSKKECFDGEELSMPRFSLNGSMDYIPAFDYIQRFRWHGYLAEVKFVKPETDSFGNTQDMSRPSLLLTIYTWKVSALQDLVDKAHQAHVALGKRSVNVHSMVLNRFDMPVWSVPKSKTPRPLGSLVLDGSITTQLFRDVQQFLDSEEWYHQKGVPYHRGYLLYGPPGTGKTSTIYTLAGEFDLEVYMLSLWGPKMNDVTLQTLISSIPRYAIIVIEDIDCIFPPPRRNDFEQVKLDPNGVPLPDSMDSNTRVTLSGLLNVLDGAGSENGRIVFATTNHLEALDPALTRAGRFDVKLQYKLATHNQASALFEHFFPSPNPEHESVASATEHVNPDSGMSDSINDTPPGYLIMNRDSAQEAVAKAAAWAEKEIAEKCRLESLRADKVKGQIQKPFDGSSSGSGTAVYPYGEEPKHGDVTLAPSECSASPGNLKKELDSDKDAKAFLLQVDPIGALTYPEDELLLIDWEGLCI
ncbi:hypothetical protein EW146_g8513 [Bondarzewia mesenterica]|uniref:AAA+ ATPase domain-containing protein n=1 Tax=Bondarzewia mesenterica TaxID=1095465 RepID=A0A4S4LE83_9AGAM|nr:hypothetical protein EW146_g8513 [Bondarzewia mesenterica]